ncbi:MAG TPA: MFS transporter [Firmicutes bacterium]|nr:MFS transporter [Bacillota bacterium]
MRSNLMEKVLLFVSLAEGFAAMTIFAYGPLYMRQVLFEPNLTIASLSLGLAQLCIFLFAGLWGRLGDWSRRPLHLVTLGLCGISGATLGLSLVGSSLPFLSLIVLYGLFAAAVAPLAMAWMTLHNRDKAARQTARYYRMRALGWAVSSLGAGALIDGFAATGYVYAFRLCAVLTLLAAAILGAMLAFDKKAAHGAPEPTPPTELPEPAAPAGINAPAKGSILLRLLPVALVCVLGFGGYSAFSAMLGPYLTEHLAGQSAQVGYAMGLMSAVEILCMAPVGRLADRLSPARILLYGAGGYMLMYALIFVVSNPWAVVALLALPVFPFMATGATGVFAAMTTAAQRGEAMGIYEASAALGGFAGSLVAGAVSEAVGLIAVPILSFLLFGAAAVILYRRVIPQSKAGQPMTVR